METKLRMQKWFDVNTVTILFLISPSYESSRFFFLKYRSKGMFLKASIVQSSLQIGISIYLFKKGTYLACAGTSQTHCDWVYFSLYLFIPILSLSILWHLQEQVNESDERNKVDTVNGDNDENIQNIVHLPHFHKNQIQRTIIWNSTVKSHENIDWTVETTKYLQFTLYILNLVSDAEKGILILKWIHHVFSFELNFAWCKIYFMWWMPCSSRFNRTISCKSFKLRW